MIGDLNDNIKINYKKLSQKIINLVLVDNTVVAIRHCRYQHSGCNITSQFFPKKEEKKSKRRGRLSNTFQRNLCLSNALHWVSENVGWKFVKSIHHKRYLSKTTRSFNCTSTVDCFVTSSFSCWTSVTSPPVRDGCVTFKKVKLPSLTWTTWKSLQSIQPQGWKLEEYHLGIITRYSSVSGGPLAVTWRVWTNRTGKNNWYILQKRVPAGKNLP